MTFEEWDKIVVDAWNKLREVDEERLPPLEDVADEELRFSGYYECGNDPFVAVAAFAIYHITGEIVA